MDSNYISGYSEASASFTFSRNNGRINVYFSVKFSWKDESLAFLFKEYFSVGKIYEIKDKNGILRAYYYRVNKLDELSVVVNYFDKFKLLGEKQQRYLKWRDMYLVRRGIISDVDIELLANELSLMNPKNK